MKYLMYFNLCVWIFKIQRAVCMDSDVNAKLNGYLVEQSDILRERFSKRRHPKNGDFENIDIEQTGNITYASSCKNVTFLFLPDENYIQIGNKYFLIDLSSIPLSLVPIANNSEEVSDGGKILFRKGIHYKNRFMVISKLESGEAYISNIYNRTISRIQKLYIPHSKDAHFFVNNDKLYLIVINNKMDNLAITSIYQWLGFHFDEIQTIFTTGAIKAASFTAEYSEIIIILHDLPNRRIFSEVYEFRNNEMKKIQYIYSVQPVNIDMYVSDAKNYVVIYEKSRNNTVFYWNGFQLLKSYQFETQTVINQSKISSINGSSILIVPLLDKLQVYRLSPRNIKMENEKFYTSNYSVISDIRNREIGKHVMSFIVGLSENNTINIKVMSIKINFSETESHFENKEILRDCFNSLEQKVYNMRGKLNETKRMLNRSTEEFGDEIDYSNVALSQKLEKGMRPDLQTEVDNIRNRLAAINVFLNDYPAIEGSNITIFGSLILNGRVQAEKLIGKDIHIKTLNGKKWVPEQWLKYKEPQTITGPVNIKKIVTKSLTTSLEDPLFKDILQKTSDQVITGSVAIQNLIANSIYAEIINKVPIKDIYLKSNPQRIKGVKIFQNLNINEGSINTFNKEDTSDVMSNFTNSSASSLVFDSNVIIENLEVETINGINWKDFKDSVFRISESSEIAGPINVLKMRTKKLTLKTLNGVAVENFLTTSTNQTIKSDIEFNRIFAQNITSNTVNGVVLKKSAVLFGDSSPVKGPVTFEKLNVVKDLELIGLLDESFFMKNVNHIIGTNESDLLQRYTGKIKIMGNLFLKNITCLPKSRLFVGENEMNPNITDIYWTTNTKQKIPVAVTAQNGLKAPHVLTEQLNDIKFSQYMLNNDDQKLETKFSFENVSIMGNVILNNNAVHTPDLVKLGKEAIKTNGSFIINGKKRYLDTLRAENLAATELLGINTFDALNTKWPMDITGTKFFKNFVIKGNMTSNIQHVEKVNDIELSKFMETLIFIDVPQNISSLNFKHLNVSDLYLRKLNGIDIDKYISSLKKLRSTDKIENLVIHGNFSVKHMKNVVTVNGIQLENLLNKTSRKENVDEVEQDVIFLGKVKVNNLATSFINDINLRNITKRFLYRKYNQTITAPYSFGNIKADNILTPKINDISLENLIDTSSTKPQFVQIPKGAEFASTATFKSLKTNMVFPCNMETILESINQPPSQEWSIVEIRGNVTLLDEENLLFRIFEKTVDASSKNVINSPVNFSSNVYIRNVFTKKLINNVDLGEIINDAVLTNAGSEQSINGKKWFHSVETKEAVVMGNADIHSVNKEDIRALDDQIVNKDQINQIIKGNKIFFGGLQTDRFYSKTISNVKPEHIMSTKSPKKVPSAIFDSIEIKNNLTLTKLNNINFTSFLQSRILTEAPDTQTCNGIYFFNNVEVIDMTTTAINDIKIDKIVFDIPGQNISSPKRFTNQVDIFGNITTDYINGIQLSTEYETSISLGKMIDIAGSITVLRPSVINNSILAAAINGYQVENIKNILNNSNHKLEALEIYEMKNQIIETVKRNLPFPEDSPAEYMYIEKSDALQISIENTTSASTIISKGYVLIHINGQQSGEFCGLPNTCQCPLQYTLEISPEHSVTTFPHKGSQRIFSYDDDNMIVHFTTNSVSTGTDCRNGKTKVLNEVSMMTWNTHSTMNSSGLFYQYHKYISGYISKVEFFTINRKSYVVIGRYYDPVIDTHDVDCTIIRFDENKTSATEIQTIPTKGAWEVYVFHTAQGVVLIIGNIKYLNQHDEEEGTTIFRFNEITEQFDLLRTVPSYGCSDATGIVLGIDSFIVLAHRDAPIQVLKYHHYFQNYYFYQSFELDAPVLGISVFYTAGFGISDAYLCIVTGNENYFIYSFKFLEGWKLESSGELEGLTNLVPFEFNSRSYIFAPSREISSLLTIVKNGCS